jgi:hypothetical protein
MPAGITCTGGSVTLLRLAELATVNTVRTGIHQQVQPRLQRLMNTLQLAGGLWMMWNTAQVAGRRNKAVRSSTNGAFCGKGRAWSSQLFMIAAVCRGTSN